MTKRTSNKTATFVTSNTLSRPRIINHSIVNRRENIFFLNFDSAMFKNEIVLHNNQTVYNPILDGKLVETSNGPKIATSVIQAK